MKARRDLVRSGNVLAGALALTGSLLLASSEARAQTGDADAKAKLQAMAAYMTSQDTLELTFDSDIEIITSELEKLQFASSGEVLLRRPDKLRAHRMGGFADVTLYFDGKVANIYGKNLNAYTQIEAPGTVDQLVESNRSGGGFALPGGDLLLSTIYATLVADVKEAKLLGRGVIDGKLCDHLAFRNFDTDWQLWVEVGEKPIPRKMVITSKTVTGAPQYTLRIKSFKTDVAPAADAFTFVVPAGATRLDEDDLAGLDELPEAVPEGVKP